MHDRSGGRRHSALSLATNELLFYLDKIMTVTRCTVVVDVAVVMLGISKTTLILVPLAATHLFLLSVLST